MLSDIFLLSLRCSDLALPAACTCENNNNFCACAILYEHAQKYLRMGNINTCACAIIYVQYYLRMRNKICACTKLIPANVQL